MTNIKPIVLILALISLTAYSGSKKDQPKLDYQTQNRKIVNLEVPPDLINPDQSDLHQIPAGSDAIRIIDLKGRNNGVQQPINQAVLKSVRGVRPEHDGSQRWLVVDGKSPAELWPLLRVFWQENGFDIKSKESAIGQMETEWAENRVKIPRDSLHRLFVKVGLGGIYSASERDKFIIRVGQGRGGIADVFFAYRGIQKVYGDKKKDTTVWQPRPNDPNLEVAFLARFMQYLDVDAKQTENALGQSINASRSAGNLAKVDNDTLLLNGDYGRNWCRTTLALDHIGLTILGQNAERRAFSVQQVPAESEAVASKKTGLFKRQFGKDKKRNAQAAARPEMIVYVEPVNGDARISLLNKDGSSYKSSGAPTLLGRLYNELC